MANEAEAAQAPGTPGSSKVSWPYAWVPHRLGEGLIGPLIPVYAATLAGATTLGIGVMEALFSGLGVLGAFVWGRTSDEVGKRKAFIVLGFLGSSLGLLGMFLADGFWALVAWRGLWGFSAAAYVAAGGALMAESSQPDEIAERMGSLHAIAGLGYVAGLAGGAYLALSRPPGDLFALAALLSLLAAGLAILLVREPTFHLRLDEMHRVLRNATVPFTAPIQHRVFSPSMMLQRPRFTGVEARAWAYLFAIFLSFLGTSSGFVLFPLYLSGVGLSPTAILSLFLVSAVLSTLMYRPAGRLADRFGLRPLQLTAVGTRSGMFLVLLLPALDTVLAAGLFLGLAGLSWAVLQATGPAALFRTMAIREKAELVGLYNIAMGLGSMGGGLVGGLVASSLGFNGLFLVAGSMVAGALVLLITVVYPRASGPAVNPRA